jgi:sortase A
MSGLRRASFVLALALAAGGAWQVAAAGWIHAKAHLAQHLIGSAWVDVLDGGPARRP